MSTADGLNACGSYNDAVEVGACVHGVGDVQTIVTEAASTMGGSFTLGYRGEVTDAIPFDASPSVVHDRLTALSTIPEIVVSRSSSINNGYRWYLTFSAAEGRADKIVADGTFLEGINAVANNYDSVVISRATKLKFSSHQNINIWLNSDCGSWGPTRWLRRFSVASRRHNHAIGYR